ncbi:helix-turn-helix domain-containing protein [Pararhizobium sp. LjRoot238]|uniref:helix-turn-helix domain-containing protein n=1 Tax=Pararhizobium sp. LjRoot238 TaxID=3342293 RepID=UPI003F50ABC0
MPSQKQLPPGYVYKAICVSPLSSTAKSVGAALVDHHNSKTGQCDPSQESLARRLGINQRAVVDALNELVHFGLFARRSHGGKGYRSAYEPNFVLATSLVADFERRRKAAVPPSETSQLHPKNKPPKRSRRGKTSGDVATAFGRQSGGDGATTLGRQSSGSGATSHSGTRYTAARGNGATQTLRINSSNVTLGGARPEKSHQSDGGSLALGPRVQNPPRPPPRPPRPVSQE